MHFTPEDVNIANAGETQFMATASNKKQKLLIQDLLSSPEIYTRCAGILKASYFDPEYQPVVEYINGYYKNYIVTPSVEQVNAEYDTIEFEETKRVTKDRIESTCDEIEKFCKEIAVRDAIYDSLENIEKGEMSKVLARVTEAVNISLQKDMGIDVFDDPEERLKSLVEAFTPIPTGIEGLDSPLDGGLIRKQFTLFSANSGVGKSLMLANLGANYALRGYDVVYLSLELAAEMVFLRLAAIFSGLDAYNWQSHIPEISSGIIQASNKKGEGSYIVKRLPLQSTAADFRSYLSYYEMEYDKTPDIFLVDYLDLMHPNGGAAGLGIFEQDKQKAEEVVELLHEYNMIGVSASQQNREALSMNTPSQAGIAGGLSKINTVDNYISLFMDDTMKLEGNMNAYFLKARSSRGTGHMSMLSFNPTNLRIGDPDGGGQTSVMPRRRKKDTPVIEELIEEINTPNKVTAKVEGMPGIVDEVSVKEPLVDLFDDSDQPPVMPKLETKDGGARLMNLMTSLSGEK